MLRHVIAADGQPLVAGKKGIMLGQNGLIVAEVPFEKAIKHHQQLSPYLVAMMDILTI